MDSWALYMFQFVYFNKIFTLALYILKDQMLGLKKKIEPHTNSAHLHVGLKSENFLSALKKSLLCFSVAAFLSYSW